MCKPTIKYYLSILLTLCINNLFAQINRNYTYREPEQKTQTAKKKTAKKATPTTFLIKGLEYGFTLGGHFANNKPANYYNGESGVNSIDRIIGKDATGINGQYSPIHQEMKDAIGYDFHVKELPKNMRYNPGAVIGFFGKININEHTGIYAEFNFNKLVTTDKFTIETENVAPGSITDEALIFGRIQGTEKRYDINAGIYQTFGINSHFTPYMEASLNFNTLHVDDASVYIDTKTETLIYSFLNPENEYYKIRDYGNGYGMNLGGGLRIIFKQSMFVNIGFNTSYKQINLGIYKGYYLSNTIYLRFNYWQKIWKAEEIER